MYEENAVIMADQEGPATPESIRLAYLPADPEQETPLERRKRLSNKRAAKYRYFKRLQTAQATTGSGNATTATVTAAVASTPAIAAEEALKRQQNTLRQRLRRQNLNEQAKQKLREQNRVRQRMRRQLLSDEKRQKVRESQRMRQRRRRQLQDDETKQRIREREKLRVRLKRQKLLSLPDAKEDPSQRPQQLSQPQLQTNQQDQHQSHQDQEVPAIAAKGDSGGGSGIAGNPLVVRISAKAQHMASQASALFALPKKPAPIARATSLGAASTTAHASATGIGAAKTPGTGPFAVASLASTASTLDTGSTNSSTKTTASSTLMPMVPMFFSIPLAAAATATATAVSTDCSTDPTSPRLSGSPLQDDPHDELPSCPEPASSSATSTTPTLSSMLTTSTSISSLTLNSSASSANSSSFVTSTFELPSISDAFCLDTAGSTGTDNLSFLLNNDDIDPTDPSDENDASTAVDNARELSPPGSTQAGGGAVPVGTSSARVLTPLLPPFPLQPLSYRTTAPPLVFPLTSSSSTTAGGTSGIQPTQSSASTTPTMNGVANSSSSSNNNNNASSAPSRSLPSLPDFLMSRDFLDTSTWSFATDFTADNYTPHDKPGAIDDDEDDDLRQEGHAEYDHEEDQEQDEHGDDDDETDEVFDTRSSFIL